jgi:hypothetical protein
MTAPHQIGFGLKDARPTGRVELPLSLGELTET